MLSTTSRADIQNAKKISAGEEAPWSGVILPFEQVMFLDSELAACGYLKDHPAPCEEETDLKGMVTVGLFSFSLGALVGLFVIRK